MQKENAFNAFLWTSATGVVNSYRKIPNINPGLIDIVKHIFGTYIYEGILC